MAGKKPCVEVWRYGVEAQAPLRESLRRWVHRFLKSWNSAKTDMNYPAPLAKSGLEWIPFTCMLFSLLSFLVLIGRRAVLEGQYAHAVMLVLLFSSMVLLVMFFFIKELWLYQEHCTLKRGFLRPNVNIPYGSIEKAKYSPHVFRSGPAIVLFYQDGNGSMRRVRFGLRKDPDHFVSILKDQGVRVVLAEVA